VRQVSLSHAETVLVSRIEALESLDDLLQTWRYRMKWKVPGCSAALLVSTCALAQVPAADTQEGKEMQIQVHSYMSEHPSVSVDDAITRLAVQGEVMPDIEALRVQFADRLTDLSIKDAPDQHILVQLKGPDPVADRTITTESGATRVVFEVGHRYTRDEQRLSPTSGTTATAIAIVLAWKSVWIRT